MITEDEITKIEITPQYNFHEKTFKQTFKIDLENKKAYWQKQDESWNGTNNIQYDSHDKLYTKIVKTYTEYEYDLKEEQITIFKKKLSDMKLLEELVLRKIFLTKDYNIPDINTKETVLDKLDKIKLVESYTLCIYTSQTKKEFKININIPTIFNDFIKAVNQLVDYDVLNSNQQKYLVNTMNYHIKQEGIYDKTSNEKLDLKRFKFTFDSSSHRGKYEFNIDFTTFEDELLDLIEDDKIVFNTDLDELRNHENYKLIIKEANNKNSVQLNLEQINQFKKLLAENNIYNWADAKSWTNFSINTSGSWVDDYEWTLEIEFDNDAIYHVAYSNGHPDSYYNFGKELQKLFNKDLLRLKDCIPID